MANRLAAIGPEPVNLNAALSLVEGEAYSFQLRKRGTVYFGLFKEDEDKTVDKAFTASTSDPYGGWFHTREVSETENLYAWTKLHSENTIVVAEA